MLTPTHSPPDSRGVTLTLTHHGSHSLPDLAAGEPHKLCSCSSVNESGDFTTPLLDLVECYVAELNAKLDHESEEEERTLRFMWISIRRRCIVCMEECLGGA